MFVYLLFWASLRLSLLLFLFLSFCLHSFCHQHVCVLVKYLLFSFVYLLFSPLFVLSSPLRFPFLSLDTLLSSHPSHFLLFSPPLFFCHCVISSFHCCCTSALRFLSSHLLLISLLLPFSLFPLILILSPSLSLFFTLVFCLFPSLLPASTFSLLLSSSSSFSFLCPPASFFLLISSLPYVPPLFCVCGCAAVVFRRCVQLICAASLLPPTPSLCKYLSPSVCVCEHVREWAGVVVSCFVSRVRPILDLIIFYWF